MRVGAIASGKAGALWEGPRRYGAAAGLTCLAHSGQVRGRRTCTCTHQIDYNPPCSYKPVIQVAIPEKPAHQRVSAGGHWDWDCPVLRCAVSQVWRSGAAVQVDFARAFTEGLSASCYTCWRAWKEPWRQHSELPQRQTTEVVETALSSEPSPPPLPGLLCTSVS